MPTLPFYRQDIDCLRAVAVVSLILFDWRLGLSGGYVATDMFFVITGYLITKTILSAVSEQRFSFTDFYVRRMRRGLPALYAVLIVLLAGSWFVLLPSDYANLFRETLATTSFLSNLMFWKQAGFFERIGIERPLLHTWALSLTVQFYLLYPVALWLLLRDRIDKAGGIIVARQVLLAVAFASFAVNTYQAFTSGTTAFYLGHGRAWEFLLGALLALGIVAAPRSQRARYAALFAALTLFVLAAISFRSTTPYPGINALFPCLAAGLVIWAGDGGLVPADNALVRAFAAVGRRSYSLYLWHWPIIVYARVWSGQGDSLTWRQEGLMLLLLVVLAFLTYRFIEVPVQRGGWPRSRRTFVTATAAIALLLVTFSGIGYSDRGVPGRFSPEALRIAAFIDYDYRAPYRAGTCFLADAQRVENYSAKDCWPAKGSNEKIVLLWGDSQAAHYAPGFEKLFAGTPFRLAQATMSSCPPVFDWAVQERPHCRAFNDMVRDMIRTHRPDYVVLAANWANLLKDDDAIIAPLQRSLAELAPRVPVGIIGPSLAFSERLPLLLTRPYRLGVDVDAQYHLSPDLGEADDAMARDFQQWGSYFSVLREVCDGGICPLLPDGEPLVWDQTHLTTAGSVWVVSHLSSLKRWLCKGAGGDSAEFCKTMAAR